MWETHMLCYMHISSCLVINRNNIKYGRPSVMLQAYWLIWCLNYYLWHKKPRKSDGVDEFSFESLSFIFVCHQTWEKIWYIYSVYMESVSSHQFVKIDAYGFTLQRQTTSLSSYSQKNLLAFIFWCSATYSFVLNVCRPSDEEEKSQRWRQPQMVL